MKTIVWDLFNKFTKNLDAQKQLLIRRLSVNCINKNIDKKE
ncbi:Uncharacterised protein [Mycoplasmopsis bovigenitalium]|uniref:Uncharacterized protein n=1 Tax=Mycoplasmopsis bovigenitalium TaxID=2112 RepID=A0A449A8M3_9BACT|nr:Uncharacterised protein [Mycoplasmopsis bovigenitalium]VEU60730.1 Uncharacterised protein [Mycoplasmopsis bovigenitalium]